MIPEPIDFLKHALIGGYLTILKVSFKDTERTQR